MLSPKDDATFRVTDRHKNLYLEASVNPHVPFTIKNNHSNTYTKAHKNLMSSL